MLDLVYSAKRGIGALARFVEARLVKPALVRETSCLTLSTALKHSLKIAKRLPNNPEDVFQDVIVSPFLEEKLGRIILETRNTKKNKAKFKSFLLCGPPGTGKTLFVKRLAQHCDLNYAFFVGSDIVKMGSESGIALNKVFEWASSSRQGVFLFIDQADAFLRKRSSEKVEFDLRPSLDAFLDGTSKESNRFLLCLESNVPEQLDLAVLNRMFEVIEFRLPGLAERERIIRHYFDKFVLVPATESDSPFEVARFDHHQVCSQVAKDTEGFSGREIAYLALTWQFSVYTSKDRILTKDMIMLAVHMAVKQHKEKVSWMSKEEAKKRIIESRLPRAVSVDY